MRQRRIGMDISDKIGLGCFGLWFGFCLVFTLACIFVLVHFILKAW